MTSTLSLDPKEYSQTASRECVPIPGGLVAEIVGAKREFWEVLHNSGCSLARPAASCLLLPVVGDRVGCWQMGDGELWIVAILERAPGAENVIRCCGNTRVEVSEGRLGLGADAVSIAAKQVRVQGEDVEVSAERARVLGGELHLLSRTLKLVGSAMHAVFDRVSQYSKQSLRTTEGMDRTHAQVLEQEADELLCQRGEHILVNGRKLVKTRGGQIHFG